MTNVLRLLGLVLLFFCPSFLPGQSQDVEEVFLTATVWARSLETATASVTVIGQEEIDQASDLPTLLASVPGLTVITTGTRGGQATVRMRGGDPNFTLVMIDGVPVNDPIYQIGDAFDLSGFPLASIQRIEIVRGPLSSRYGSTGLAGAVNLITHRGSTGNQVALEMGEQGTSDLYFTGKQTFGAAQLVFGGGFEEEQEQVAEERFKSTNYHARLEYAVDEDRLLTITTRWMDWEADDYPDASGGPIYGSGALRSSEHREMTAGVTYRLPKSLFEAQAYRHEMERDAPPIFPQVPPSTEDARFQTLRLSWRSELRNGQTWKVNLGLDARRERGENSSNLLLPPEFGGNVSGDYLIERDTAGVFVEALANRDSWVLEATSRLDVLDGERARWNPRLGARYRHKSDATFRFSMGRAFKLPSFFASASPAALGGNPDLKPEESVGADLGVDWSRGPVSVEMTVFANRFENLVDFDFARFLHVNRSEVTALGAEFALDWQPSSKWEILARATHQDVEDRDTGETPRHRPEWSGSLQVRHKPTDRLSWTLTMRSNTSYRDQQIPVTDRFEVAGSTRLELTGFWRFNNHLSLGIRAQNLTHKSYESLIGFPAKPRTYHASLRWRPR